jgi:hypothetical protein
LFSSSTHRSQSQLLKTYTYKGEAGAEIYCQHLGS